MLDMETDQMYVLNWKEFSGKPGPLQKLGNVFKGRSFIRAVSEKNAVSQFKHTFPRRNIVKVEIDKE